jgi:hypothetical protein
MTKVMKGFVHFSTSCSYSFFPTIIWMPSFLTADLLFGGSDAPAALGNLYSIGAINRVTNGAIHASVSDILEPFGVSADRIYINFFDMDPANIGWNRATFAD